MTASITWMTALSALNVGDDEHWALLTITLSPSTVMAISSPGGGGGSEGRLRQRP